MTLTIQKGRKPRPLFSVVSFQRRATDGQVVVYTDHDGHIKKFRLMDVVERLLVEAEYHWIAVEFIDGTGGGLTKATIVEASPDFYKRYLKPILWKQETKKHRMVQVRTWARLRGIAGTLHQGVLMAERGRLDVAHHIVEDYLPEALILLDIDASAFFSEHSTEDGVLQAFGDPSLLSPPQRKDLVMLGRRRGRSVPPPPQKESSLSEAAKREARALGCKAGCTVPPPARQIILKILRESGFPTLGPDSLRKTLNHAGFRTTRPNRD